MSRLCKPDAPARVRRTEVRHRLLLVLAMVLFPGLAYAYAGPGAGFAVLSSFWAIFVAFLYSLYALMTWPIRQLYRKIRNRNAYGKAKFKRAVILGFDGMDPELADRFMNEGKLPNLAKLRDKGTFTKLRTTFPAISPVAWSTFMTGVNPGKHNIYDFLARDASNYLPFLSSAEIKGPTKAIKIGKYSIPWGKTEVKNMRKGTPFWHWLGKAGIFSSVIRVPVTFPPEKFSGVLLSGMCVPDLKGSQGTFCLCTTRMSDDKFREGGVRVPMERRNGVCYSYVPGPDNPIAETAGHEMRVKYEVRPDAGGQQARFVVGSEKFTLKVGEYSDWTTVEFKAGLGFNAHGICRFYLKEVSPEVEVYVSPVNIDPGHPDLPISHPVTYSIYLAKLFGPFATLGLAEDTWALNEHVLDDDAFLAQCYSNHEDRERMLFDALEKTQQGLCTCVFDTTDRIQHMFWRYLDIDHPAARDVPQGKRPQVIPELYQKMDKLIGRVMEKINDDTLLLVISDHGFKSFARCMNLNAWLHQNGYLALKGVKTESGDWFEDVDWSRTRAYTMGLNGLYINIKGREKQGIVEPAEADTLKKEIQQKLNGLKDPDSGAVGITGVFITDNVYSGPYSENAPDILVGYAAGYRASWDSVLGKVTGQVFEDNLKAWSGDHCIDPRLVPGVLFSSHKFVEDKPHIADVAPTILTLFGLQAPSHFDGKAWNLAS
ncbi:MAG TPA: alkaline phosphatase family protein [Terriglobales bacterium]|jgi:predicted AlkP superfamily phosphohydrolase/phosphomutase|nr:alkaline phosphatase family protein [Terriglobales bacterium]